MSGAFATRFNFVEMREFVHASPKALSVPEGQSPCLWWTRELLSSRGSNLLYEELLNDLRDTSQDDLTYALRFLEALATQTLETAFSVMPRTAGTLRERHGYTLMCTLHGYDQALNQDVSEELRKNRLARMKEFFSAREDDALIVRMEVSMGSRRTRKLDGAAAVRLQLLSEGICGCVDALDTGDTALVGAFFAAAGFHSGWPLYDIIFAILEEVRSHS